MDLLTQSILVVLMIVALLVGIIGHEIMHGLVAYHYGDTSAKEAKRLSVNPIRHIDIVGSIILPAVLYCVNAPFLFGWAKPVPVNIHYIIERNGYGAAIGVAIAGVSYNFALALLASIILNSGFFDTAEHTISSAIVVTFLIYLIKYNVFLCFFNLLPIPPLDGSRVLIFAALKFRFLQLAKFLENIAPYGMIILIIVLFIPTLSDILFYPVTMLLKFLLL